MRAAALVLLLLAESAAFAQPAIEASAPEAVSITLYRNPDRQPGQPLNLSWLGGFALVTETRQVTIPAGEATIRFEGVAGGILPESAIITGLPDGVREKNQDAALLSPAGLLERSLGRRVTLRRTSRATGEVREHDAIVRSGPDGAVLLQTPEGFEALRCSGLNETILYDGIPEGLSARPTLSVRTIAREAIRGTVTLSYLASGFDWQANYVATLSPAGDQLDLFAWVTLANGDETSFADANTQAVAGRLNREEERRAPQPTRASVALRCWPSANTSSLAALPPPPPPPPPAPMAFAEDIVVTAQRRANMLQGVPVAMQAVQEELGDLKLYRIPERVTVAANSQKQVAMLERKGVKVRQIARSYVWGEGDPPVLRVLRTRNRTAEGLGLPLPAGNVALFAGGEARPILLGEGNVADKAIGEDVDLEFGPLPGVVARVESPAADSYRLTVTNDSSRPVSYEAILPNVTSQTKLARRNGRPVWATTIPANGSATLDFRLVQTD